MKETPKALAAFNEYCLLGPGRSLAKLAHRGQTEGKPWARLATLELWSSAHQWVVRAASYDAEQRAVQRQQQEEAIRQMNERHIALAINAQKRVLEMITHLEKGQSYGLQAAVAYMKYATDLERIARGAVTEATSVELTGKDGAPLPEVGRIAIYLPQKNAPPGLAARGQTEEGEETA